EEESHVIHDTYTGLEYRYRAALDEILHMAERHEFDVLCLDVLDRGLGRKGVSREIFRGQLRELGIHILTTEKSDHSDDDSLEGQLMRLLKGYKAEEEINDFVRRTKNAKRDKALGNPAKGIPPKVIGNGSRDYGYEYVRDAEGKVETIAPNYDVVLVDSKGIEWTEVRVMVFMFRCAKHRIPLRGICRRLNKIGIPTPSVSKGTKYASNGVHAEKLVWEVSVVSRLLRKLTYSGKKVVNTQHAVRVPELKYRRRITTSPEEQIIVPVPAIVSIELQEEVIRNLQRNQKFSRRNNQSETPVLLYGGLAKCGNCGRTAREWRQHWNLKGGGEQEYTYYQCMTRFNSLHTCPGCCINARLVDTAAWNEALKIIHNPFIADKALEDKKSKDPTAERRRQINQDLTKNRNRQKNIRADLVRMSGDGKLDFETEEAYLGELKDLKRVEQGYITALADDEKIHQEWQAAEKVLERLHKKCAVIRDKLKRPGYEPDFKDKRDMIEFFGMTAIIWNDGHINPQNGKPEHFRIQAKFNDIVLHLPSDRSFSD
ncbi:MAG TPA: recombinase family protein, partial [Ktedonobacteraceae bacterium]